MTIIPSSVTGVSGHFSIKRETPCSSLFTDNFFIFLIVSWKFSDKIW